MEKTNAVRLLDKSKIKDEIISYKVDDIEKWCHPASYQERLSDNTVRCNLCPHNCIVRVGKTGICRTRINRGGELYTLAYGNPCSLSVDPIEKKPLFHFFQGSEIYSLATAGCNFRCLNCQNWSISQASPGELEHYNLTPHEVVNQALHHNTGSIAFTYTEPTVFYEYIYDIAKAAHEKEVKTVLISNGYINQKPLMDLCPYLDAANIDLKCFDDAVYHKLTGGRLQPVLDTLKTLKEKGVWLEITHLVIPAWTDRPEMIEAMCEWLAGNGFTDTPLHFSRFFPTFNLSQLQPTPANILVKAKEIAEKTGIKYVYIGNLPGIHGENTCCPKCGQTLVEREGYLIKKNNIKKGTDVNIPNENKLGENIPDGLCGFCGEIVPGVWGGEAHPTAVWKREIS
ncbi:MAG: AmmeMemoRadiSam system radical SAM enzyme [Rikenellaceae bacterium]